MLKLSPLQSCVLSEINWVRLTWAFEQPTDQWPALEKLDVTKIVIHEDVQADWRHSGVNFGLDAMPKQLENTAAGHHGARFFTNAFYPWISRKLTPGL